MYYWWGAVRVSEGGEWERHGAPPVDAAVVADHLQGPGFGAQSPGIVAPALPLRLPRRHHHQ